MAEYFAGGHLRFVDGEWRDDDGNVIEVAPVRHGRWVKMDTTGLLAVEPVWNCSSCGYPVGVSVAGSKYCPNCGCMMDLED